MQIILMGNFNVFNKVARLGRYDVGAKDVAEVADVEDTGFVGPEEPDDVGPAGEWGSRGIWSFEGGREV